MRKLNIDFATCHRNFEECCLGANSPRLRKAVSGLIRRVFGKSSRGPSLEEQLLRSYLFRGGSGIQPRPRECLFKPWGFPRVDNIDTQTSSTISKSTSSRMQHADAQSTDAAAQVQLSMNLNGRG